VAGKQPAISYCDKRLITRVASMEDMPEAEELIMDPLPQHTADVPLAKGNVYAIVISS
jgi:hypothetical protein